MENFLIICIASQSWDTPLKTNRHYMMGSFALHNKVLFIESLGLRAPTINNQDISRIFAKIRGGLRGKRRTSIPNLFTLDPLVLPVGMTSRIGWLDKLNHRLLEIQIKVAIRSIDHFSPRILWAYVPTAVQLIGQLGESLTIYDCVDDFSSVPSFAQKIRDQDQLLAKQSDVVFALSTPILEDKLPINPNTYYAPGAADPDLWSQALDPSLPIPDDIAHIPKPIIGYFGNLADHKQDFDLLNYLAEQEPSWSIVLIGPRWAGSKNGLQGLDRLAAYSNVFLLGSKEHNILPAYLKAFDVCMLPQAKNTYARSSFPMKLFEYLGGGRPVVASWTESLDEFSDVIWLAKTYEEFRAGVRYYLNSDTHEAFKQRLEVARRNAWECRLKVLEVGVMDAFDRKWR